MTAQTFAEKVLSEKSGRRVNVGDIVVCEADLILGTDGSTPMAIEGFEHMGGSAVAFPERVILSRDHYAPPGCDATVAYHARMEAFASDHGLELLSVGDGIGFSVALETGRIGPGDLVIGADSHTVTCGAAGAFATGIGSTDLAAAFLTGKVWLRVPKTLRIVLDGVLPSGVTPKDVALDVVKRLGTAGAIYTALEFVGPVAESLGDEGRRVIANMSVETGAKVGVFPSERLCSDEGSPRLPDFRLDCSRLEPLIALPHDPSNCVPASAVRGSPIDWVFIGTCTTGHADGFRDALQVLMKAGGIAEGVRLVVTPPSRHVRDILDGDGTLDGFRDLGATVTETGCGPCCGTSEPVPPPGARVISTANRNFRGRMGENSALIHLASPITCAAAAATGIMVDPREVF